MRGLWAPPRLGPLGLTVRLRCCDNAVLPSAKRGGKSPDTQDRCGQGSESFRTDWLLKVAWPLQNYRTGAAEPPK
jgi:hypothetical protein